jgi:hypothetical protein
MKRDGFINTSYVFWSTVGTAPVTDALRSTNAHKRSDCCKTVIWDFAAGDQLLCYHRRLASTTQELNLR